MTNSFVECIGNICGLELSTLLGGYKYTVFDGKVAVVEGHKGIYQYCKDKVVFSISKGKLTVIGANMVIKCMQKGYTALCGRIDGVEVTLDE